MPWQRRNVPTALRKGTRAWSCATSGGSRAGRVAVQVREVTPVTKPQCRPAKGSPVELNLSLTALRDAGDIDSVLNLLQCRLLPDRVSYNITLSALERSARWQTAIRIFERMQGGSSPNLISFNTLLSSLARGRKWQAVLNLLFDGAPVCLRRARISPDAISVGTAIAACARAIRWQVALTLLCQLGRFQEKITMNARRAAVTSALWACGAASRWLQGLHLLHPTIRHLKADASLMGAAVSACAFGQAWELAIAFLAVAEHRSLSNVAVRRSAIAACELENWPTALLLLEFVQISGPDPAGVSSAISAAAKAARWELALFLVQAPLLPSPGLHAAVQALAQAAKWVESLELVREMRRDPGSLSLTAATVTVAQLRSLFSRLVRRLRSAAFRNWHVARGTAAQDEHLGNLMDAMDLASFHGASETPTLLAYSCLLALQSTEPLEVSQLRPGPCLLRSTIDLNLNFPGERSVFARSARREVIEVFASTGRTGVLPEDASASSLLVWLAFEISISSEPAGPGQNNHVLPRSNSSIGRIS
ncbi:unnamed protein product [Symbiodinium sp. CCMP2592]|nr:unnamed protein product [Symbiodinium sp. CCMP2592]